MSQALKYHEIPKDLGEVFKYNIAVDSFICLLSFYSTLSQVSSFFQQPWSIGIYFRVLDAYIFCFAVTRLQKKHLWETIPIPSIDKIISRNITTEVDRHGIPFSIHFTFKTLLRRLQQLSYKHLMLGDRIIPPRIHSVEVRCTKHT